LKLIDFQLVAAAKVSSEDRSPLVHLVSDLRGIFGHKRVSDFLIVERSRVRVSHNLANLAKKYCHTVTLKNTVL
jgi:hypothetical protein